MNKNDNREDYNHYQLDRQLTGFAFIYEAQQHALSRAADQKLGRFLLKLLSRKIV